MRVAQKLYEGIELSDEGNVGLISYMRTDSVTLADVAVAEIRDVIKERYGAENVPDDPRTFKTKSKNAQEAHEAIRPTSVARTPESLKGMLDKDQLKLYTLIWRRTMACQMVPAVFDTVALEFSPGESSVDEAGDAHRFRANGSVLVEPGFMAVYHEGRDDSKTTMVIDCFRRFRSVTSSISTCCDPNSISRNRRHDLRKQASSRRSRSTALADRRPTRASLPH